MGPQIPSRHGAGKWPASPLRSLGGAEADGREDSDDGDDDDELDEGEAGAAGGGSGHGEGVQMWRESFSSFLT